MRISVGGILVAMSFGGTFFFCLDVKSEFYSKFIVKRECLAREIAYQGRKEVCTERSIK